MAKKDKDRKVAFEQALDDINEKFVSSSIEIYDISYERNENEANDWCDLQEYYLKE